MTNDEPVLTTATVTVKEETPQWCILELMGHVKVAGKLSEEERFGCKMGRLDIPQAEGFVTQHFGGQSVYRITYCTEEVARAVADRDSPAPVAPWHFPKALPAASTYRPEDDGPNFDPDDD